MFDQIFRCMSSIRFSISDNKRVNQCRRLPPSQHPMLLTNLEGHSKTSLKHDKPLNFFSQIIHPSFDVEPSSTLRLMYPSKYHESFRRLSKGIEADESWELRPMALRRGAGYTNQTPMAVTGGCFRRGSVYKYYPFGGIKEFRDFPYYNAFFGLGI